MSDEQKYDQPVEDGIKMTPEEERRGVRILASVLVGFFALLAAVVAMAAH